MQIGETACKPRIVDRKTYANFLYALKAHPELEYPGYLLHAVDRSKHIQASPYYLVDRGLPVERVGDPEDAISLHMNPHNPRKRSGFYNGNFSFFKRGLGILFRPWLTNYLSGRGYLSDAVLNGMLKGAQITPLGVLVEGDEEAQEKWYRDNLKTMEFHGIRVDQKDKRGLPDRACGPNGEVISPTARKLFSHFLFTSTVIRRFKERRERELSVNGQSIIDPNYGLRAVVIEKDGDGLPHLRAMSIPPGMMDLILELDDAGHVAVSKIY